MPLCGRDAGAWKEGRKENAGSFSRLMGAFLPAAAFTALRVPLPHRGGIAARRFYLYAALYFVTVSARRHHRRAFPHPCGGRWLIPNMYCPLPFLLFFLAILPCCFSFVLLCLLCVHFGFCFRGVGQRQTSINILCLSNIVWRLKEGACVLL